MARKRTSDDCGEGKRTAASSLEWLEQHREEIEAEVYAMRLAELVPAMDEVPPNAVHYELEQEEDENG